jgi:hypothetical protein
MKVKQNIGIINALIRITVGFTVLTWCTAKLVKKPWRESYLLMAMLGAMKIGEGILRYCPVTAMFDNNNEASHDSKQGKKHTPGDGLQEMMKNITNSGSQNFAQKNPGNQNAGGNGQSGNQNGQGFTQGHNQSGHQSSQSFSQDHKQSSGKNEPDIENIKDLQGLEEILHKPSGGNQ